MRKNLKRVFLLLSIITFSFLCYRVYDFLSFSWIGEGCGMDDGPFNAVVIDPVDISESSQKFELSDKGELVLENRKDSLSPILTLIENGKVKWTLDADTRNTEGYESTRFWKISNVTVAKNTNPIKLNFAGHWTYGVEAGTMVIDRKDGDNSFCLSW